MLRSSQDVFICLQTNVVQTQLLRTLGDVVVNKQPLVLVQGKEHQAAIIPSDEFERLELLRYDIAVCT